VYVGSLSILRKPRNGLTTHTTAPTGPTRPEQPETIDAIA
jgi:hypothetical protein